MLQKLLASRKVWVALATLIAAVLAAVGLPVDENVVITVVTAIVGLGGVVIGAIAHEDAAEKRAAGDVVTQSIIAANIDRKITAEQAATRIPREPTNG